MEDYSAVLQSFCSEYQRVLAEYIVSQADALNPQARAALDRFLDGYAGPIEGDPRDDFWALANNYIDVAFGIGFAMGHSAEAPAIRPMVRAFIEKLKQDGANPQPEIPSDFAFEDSAPAGNA